MFVMPLSENIRTLPGSRCNLTTSVCACVCVCVGACGEGPFGGSAHLEY